MGVLSGDEERVGTFIAEYLRVVGTSAWLACDGGSRVDDDSRGVLARLLAVVGTATDGVGVALRKAASTVRVEHKRGLDPLRPPVAVAAAPAMIDDELALRPTATSSAPRARASRGA